MDTKGPLCTVESLVADNNVHASKNCLLAGRNFRADPGSVGSHLPRTWCKLRCPVRKSCVWPSTQPRPSLKTMLCSDWCLLIEMGLHCRNIKTQCVSRGRDKLSLSDNLRKITCWLVWPNNPPQPPPSAVFLGLYMSPDTLLRSAATRGLLFWCGWVAETQPVGFGLDVGKQLHYH